MAELINDAFDTSVAVSIMLIFAPSDGAKVGAGLDLKVLTLQFRSIIKVDKYAVVGAPTFPATIIKVMDKTMPVNIRTLLFDEEDQAWAIVEARPR